MVAQGCGSSSAKLSALVDGALTHRERDQVARHALSCHWCQDELAKLRHTRAILRSAGQRSTPTAPDERLAARLMAIPDQHRQGLTRRARRAVVVLSVTAVSLLTLTGTASAIGWAAAPPAPAAIGDPGAQGEQEFIALEAGRPLGSEVVAAMMASDDQPMTETPVAISPRGIAPGQELSATQVRGALAAVTSSATVSLIGTQVIRVDRGDQHLVAEAKVRSRVGQGTQVTVRTSGGRVLSETFSAEASGYTKAFAPTNVLHPGQTVTGWDGQIVAGRTAVLLQLDGLAGIEARWWIDAETGVQLWREVWSDGAPEQSVGFTSVRIGVAEDFWPHLQPQLSVSQTTSAMALSSAGGLHAQGWACHDDLAGLPLQAVRRDDGGEVLHTVYGGATQTVSVIQQRGSLADPPEEFQRTPSGLWVSDGWPAQATWQAGSSVFTVTADSPEQVAEVAAALPQPTPVDRSPWHRVLAGWQRISSLIFG